MVIISVELMKSQVYNPTLFIAHIICSYSITTYIAIQYSMNSDFVLSDSSPHKDLVLYTWYTKVEFGVIIYFGYK